MDSSQEGEPIISAQINAEKGFAFLEFRNIADCTKCLAFDNVEVRGAPVRLRRPKDYVRCFASVCELRRGREQKLHVNLEGPEGMRG